MINNRKWMLSACLMGAVALSACGKGGNGSETLQSGLSYDDGSSTLLVQFNRDLKGAEDLHLRVRSLAEGESLNCATDAGDIPSYSEKRGNGEYAGPKVEADKFETETTPETLLNQTEEAYNQRLADTYFVDICVMNGSNVAHQARYDLRQALDRDGDPSKADEFDDGERIASNQKYAEACISSMGDIPFWTRLSGEQTGSGVVVHGIEEGTAVESAILQFVNDASADELDAELDSRAVEGIVAARPFPRLTALDQVAFVDESAFGSLQSYVVSNELVGAAPVEGTLDWDTVDCMEVGTPIPTTVNGEMADDWVDQCDDPQTIYSHCEPDARTGANGPRVAHARNDQGTHWVLLCRKSHEAQGRFEDMAMIGHNPFTGQTCFFQNQLPFGETPRPSNNGMKIPHPADDVSSEASPEVWGDMWAGIEGGIGPEGGIQCMGCHSTDAFVHSPWIDGAKDEFGNSVVPKIGENPDFVEGYNGPYKLLDAIDQGWNEPMHLVSEEASACTKCHRIGKDQWTSAQSISSRSNEDGGCVFCGQAPWLNRLDHKDARWDGLLTEHAKQFENYYWMPPNANEVLNEELWPGSEYAQALEFIRTCGAEPTNPACVWESLPKEPGDPTDLPEIEMTGPDLAKEALGILGAPYQDGELEVESTRRCAECHAVSKRNFRDWASLSSTAISNGIDLSREPGEYTQEEALEVIHSMRKRGEGTVFAGEKMGIFAAGSQFPYFKKLFQTGYGADWGVHYGAFLSRVSMPKGSHPPLSAEEFAIVNKWFNEENLANMDELLIEVPPPATCEEVESRYELNGASPWLQTHIDNMQFEGWGAINQERGINMYGCDGTDPLDCFTSGQTEKAEWSTGIIPGARLVEVSEFDFNTSFWMRTSADGRFVGNGGAGSDTGQRATITDLLTERNIGVRGSYDPGFFPNNDGFIMQGGGAGLCGQSVLTNEEYIADGIDFSEPGCTTAEGINLYQHVAVSTDGQQDYFVINSQFQSDSGSNNSDPTANFSETSTMKFSPMVFDGTTWTQKEQVVVDSPYEGDSVLSPSGELVISRFAGPEGVSLGYMIRRVDATPRGETYDISVRDRVQFICAPGAKANISFDERWSVTHHYENDTANLYLTDILTGETRKITEMPSGVKALFPHFRSDGWIYFLVSSGEGGDRAIASDAALQWAGQ